MVENGEHAGKTSERVGDCDNSDAKFGETQRKEKPLLTGIFRWKQPEGL